MWQYQRQCYIEIFLGQRDFAKTLAVNWCISPDKAFARGGTSTSSTSEFPREPLDQRDPDQILAFN
jgi:hypothetical protein